MESSTPGIASKRMSQPDKIEVAIREADRPLTVAEISARTGLPRNVIRAVLSRFSWQFGNIQPGQHVGCWALAKGVRADAARVTHTVLHLKKAV